MNLDAVKDFRVLMVGDGIIDEYCYVTPLGKSIKDIAISARYDRKETFRGGVWIAAEHVRGFCSHVDVMTGSHTMTNRRFVEESGMRKMFTVHESWANGAQEDFDIGAYDLVIVTDFGHGTLTKNLIARLSDEAKFLAVNAQTNTTNFGFNMITKYPRADFVVIDELEIRLAAHDRDSPIKQVVEHIASGYAYGNIIVTMGANGALGFDGGGFYHEPAKAARVIDSIGAGDAFLAVTSPFAAAGFNIRELVTIGNAAAAIHVGTVGNKTSVTRAALEAQLVK